VPKFETTRRLRNGVIEESWGAVEERCLMSLNTQSPRLNHMLRNWEAAACEGFTGKNLFTAAQSLRKKRIKEFLRGGEEIETPRKLYPKRMCHKPRFMGKRRSRVGASAVKVSNPGPGETKIVCRWGFFVRLNAPS